MTTDTLERPLESAAPDALLQTEQQGAPASGTGHTHLAHVQKTMVEFDAVAAGLADLSKKYKDVVFAVGTTTGMAEAKLARAAIRDPRIAVGKAIAAGKAPLNELKRLLEGKGLEIVNALVELETPIHEQIKAEEDRKAAEKVAREAEAAAAAARVQASIDVLRNTVVDAAGKTAAEILTLRESLVDPVEITLEAFGDRAGEAMQVKAASVSKLNELHAAAVASEAAQANLAVVQQELAAMRAADDARLAAERETAAAALVAEAQRQAAERKKFDDERAAFQEEQRLAREAEAARVEAARQAEADRVAEEQRLQREADEAEQARLDQVAADARAEADRIATAAREEADRMAEAARVEAARIADEARAAEEAAQAAHQKVRNAAHTLLAALQDAIPFIGYEGAGAEDAKAAAYAAVAEATGETA
jgi:hypothetical protein